MPSAFLSINTEWNLCNLVLVHRRLYPSTERLMEEEAQALGREESDGVMSMQENTYHGW